MMMGSPLYLLVLAEDRRKQNGVICANESIISRKEIESSYNINRINSEKNIPGPAT